MIITNVLDIYALDILSSTTDSAKIVCTVLLVRQSGGHIVLEPVLDYLENDEPLAGLSISSVFMVDPQEVMKLLVNRKLANGYGSTDWTWEKINSEIDELNVAIQPIYRPFNTIPSKSAYAYQINGNVCYEVFH